MPSRIAGAVAVLILITGAAGQAGGAAAEPSTPRGLYVRNGVLLKAGQPYRGIGANYFDLFARVLRNPDDPAPLAGLQALSKAGIPFVRFMAGGFWPAEHKLYLDDKDEYFRRMDRVVRAAEEAHVGLIPSLFWNYATVPDLVGEPMDQLGHPRSKSIAFIQRYTEEMVSRYRDSPAIWGWEFGNEYNLPTDLPNAAEHRPPVVPNLGTPAQRTARDDLKWKDLRVALLAFATSVRKVDKDRIILTGHAVPRTSAYHHVSDGSWKPDTHAQFAEILKRDNPDPIDTLSVHIYHEASGVYSGPARSIDESLAAASAVAQQAGKPLVVGEFGAQRALGERARPVFEEFLAALEKHRVPLAMFWVFDYAGQDTDWNVTLTNDRAYMVELVGKANARLGAAGR